MKIPRVEREPRVQVQGRVPVSDLEALKALAADSGVSLSRAVAYAVERLLAAARDGEADALRCGGADAGRDSASGDVMAEVAGRLGLGPVAADGEATRGVPAAPAPHAAGLAPGSGPALPGARPAADRGGASTAVLTGTVVGAAGDV